MISHTIARNEIRKLARKGKLMDTAFKHFQRAVYPGAPPDQVRELRTTFMAGAAELHALMVTGVDDTSPEETSAAEEAMIFAVFEEIQSFHRRTVDLAMQKPDGTGNA